MNNDQLLKILIDNKIYIRDKQKNHICKCFVCGDHKDPKKVGHLWISKNPEIPVGHCFMCNYSAPIPKLIYDLTSDRQLSKTVIDETELQKAFSKKKITGENQFESKSFKIPEIDESYPLKKLYIRKRTFNRLDIEKIPNLILDIRKFFSINNLMHLVGNEDNIDEGQQITASEFNNLAANFVAFLCKNNSLLICRCINDDAYIKFRKIELRPFPFLDYYSVKGGNPNSDTVVLTEGIFNIFGELVRDSLSIRNDVRLFAACNTFSYTSLLKSVCFDQDLYQVDVVILSDNDKANKYYKFKRDNSHIIKSLKIFYNSCGKDFGEACLKPILGS